MVAHFSLESSQAANLYLEQLPPATRRAFLSATKLSLFTRGGWYLAGGTALALQVGHRQSVDLDFFTPRNKFSENSVERNLLATKQWVTSFREEGTLYGTLSGAKMSFIAYPFFQPGPVRLKVGAVSMLLPANIAAMKIVAISQRGRKRDFVDLYWYCRNREPLAAIIRRALEQYPGQGHNAPHILKSLTYFADAEADPMPHLFFKASWRTIKLYFQREATKIAKEFLGLK